MSDELCPHREPPAPKTKAVAYPRCIGNPSHDGAARPTRALQSKAMAAVPPGGWLAGCVPAVGWQAGQISIFV